MVGFAQVGAESEWRTGNSASIQDAAESLGVELKFADGQQAQENQIKAIRTFIAQQVDVIGVSPVVETGWESVFQEANDAGIPIILVDRQANVPEDLYATHLGSDFVEEGRNAARVMVKLLNGKGNIVELTGTQDSAPALDRYSGFREVLKNYPEIQHHRFAVRRLHPRPRPRGDGRACCGNTAKTSTRCMRTMTTWPSARSRPSRNYGLKPGEDIKIVSIDAIRDAFQAMIDGKLNATVECNPLLGPKFFELALQVVNGEPVPKWIPSMESVYYPENAAEILPTRKY